METGSNYKKVFSNLDSLDVHAVHVRPWATCPRFKTLCSAPATATAPAPGPGPFPALAPAPAVVVVADGAVVSAPRCCCCRQSIARSDQAADCSRRGWDQ